MVSSLELHLIVRQTIGFGRVKGFVVDKTELLGADIDCEIESRGRTKIN